MKKAKAKELGFFGGRLRAVGDEFIVPDDVKASWFDVIGEADDEELIVEDEADELEEAPEVDALTAEVQAAQAAAEAEEGGDDGEADDEADELEEANMDSVETVERLPVQEAGAEVKQEKRKPGRPKKNQQ